MLYTGPSGVPGSYVSVAPFDSLRLVSGRPSLSSSVARRSSSFLFSSCRAESCDCASSSFSCSDASSALSTLTDGSETAEETESEPDEPVEAGSAAQAPIASSAQSSSAIIRKCFIDLHPLCIRIFGEGDGLRFSPLSALRCPHCSTRFSFCQFCAVHYYNSFASNDGRDGDW